MKHTSQPFEEELTKLKDSLLLMGGMIESGLLASKDALLKNDGVQAKRIIADDTQIDQMEKGVDELALSILALRQPTAGDLRFVAAAMKICTDLERMGDIIVNICERISELSTFDVLKPYQDLPKMFDLTSKMISASLDAFVKQSAEMANEVLRSDDAIDGYYRKISDEVKEMMRSKPENIDRGLKLIFIAKHLERMADHATNIAEQVVFTVKGLDIRHSGHVAPSAY